MFLACSKDVSSFLLDLPAPSLRPHPIPSLLAPGQVPTARLPHVWSAKRSPRLHRFRWVQTAAEPSGAPHRVLAERHGAFQDTVRRAHSLGCCPPRLVVRLAY